MIQTFEEAVCFFRFLNRKTKSTLAYLTQVDRRFSCMCTVLLQQNKELVDPRGRTPLHLAVTLGYVDCVKCLLRGGCDANAINNEGWNGRSADLFALILVSALYDPG